MIEKVMFACQELPPLLQLLCFHYRLFQFLFVTFSGDCCFVFFFFCQRQPRLDTVVAEVPSCGPKMSNDRKIQGACKASQLCISAAWYIFHIPPYVLLFLIQLGAEFECFKQFLSEKGTFIHLISCGVAMPLDKQVQKCLKVFLICSGITKPV